MRTGAVRGIAPRPTGPHVLGLLLPTAGQRLQAKLSTGPRQRADEAGGAHGFVWA